MRLVWLFLVLALLVLIPFLIWGEWFEDLFAEEGARRWLEQFGLSWAWLVGMGLLVADLFLPILGTAVMGGLGYLYGPLVGGIAAALGSMLSGLLAFGLCRTMGRRAAVFIAGERDLARGERIFRGDAGGWIVALSRWLPMMPEVVACLAGMAHMPAKRFVAALACGSVPLGFTFALIGSWGHERPVLTILLSVGLPPLLWMIVKPLVGSRMTVKPRSVGASAASEDSESEGEKKRD